MLADVAFAGFGEVDPMWPSQSLLSAITHAQRANAVEIYASS